MLCYGRYEKQRLGKRHQLQVREKEHASKLERARKEYAALEARWAELDDKRSVDAQQQAWHGMA